MCVRACVCVCVLLTAEGFAGYIENVLRLWVKLIDQPLVKSLVLVPIYRRGDWRGGGSEAAVQSLINCSGELLINACFLLLPLSLSPTSLLSFSLVDGGFTVAAWHHCDVTAVKRQSYDIRKHTEKSLVLRAAVIKINGQEMIEWLNRRPICLCYHQSHYQSRLLLQVNKSLITADAKICFLTFLYRLSPCSLINFHSMRRNDVRSASSDNNDPAHKNRKVVIQIWVSDGSNDDFYFCFLTWTVTFDHVTPDLASLHSSSSVFDLELILRSYWSTRHGLQIIFQTL